MIRRPVHSRVCNNSATGTRTRVARVRAEYPDQLDYSGVAKEKIRRHQDVGIYFEGVGQCVNSATGTRTRVARVRDEYPDQLDYSGVAEEKNGASCT